MNTSHDRSFSGPRKGRRAGFALSSLLLSLVLAACGISSGNPVSGASGASQPVVSGTSLSVATGVSVADALAANQKSHADANDADYDPASAVQITLNGSGASVAGDGATVIGSTVSISAPGTYLISGTLNDGQISVSSTVDGKVRLVLNGATISSSKSAAINIIEADEAIIVLAPDTVNTLKGVGATDGSDAPNATLYSAADLTIGGTGALAVSGNVDGIASKDGLVVLNGRITVDAGDDGVRGKDYLRIEGGSLTVTSGGDGLKSDNEEAAERGYVAILAGTVNVVSSGDAVYGFTDVVVGDGTITAKTNGTTGTNAPSTKGLKAGTQIVVGGGTLALDTVDDSIHSDGSISIPGGTISLSTGDDAIHAEKVLTVSGGSITIVKSYEGLEASQIVIEGGDIVVNSSDDAVNAADGSGNTAMPDMGGRGVQPATGSANSLTITGGTITINSNGDGLDANGTFTMSGGLAVVSGPTMAGNGALDVDGNFTVSGGTLLAAGSSGMAIAPATNSPQAWVSVTFAQAIPAGTVIQIADGSTVIASYKTEKAVQSVIFSSAAIKSGGSYDVYTGGTQAGNTYAGYADSGSLSGASKVQTVTAGQHTAGRGGFRR